MVCIHVRRLDGAECRNGLQQKFDDASISVQFDSVNSSLLCESFDAEEVMDILHQGGYVPSLD